jgi:hypothetical protein
MTTNPPKPRDEADALADAVRDAMTPEAVACIAAALQMHRSKDEIVDHEVAWFRDMLIDVLGGHEALTRIRNELDV